MPVFPAANFPDGIWTGSTQSGRDIVGIVLDTGTYYFLYAKSSAPSVIEGVVQGSLTPSVDNAQNHSKKTTSSDARDFNLAGLKVSFPTVAVEYSGPVFYGQVKYASNSALNGSMGYDFYGLSLNNSYYTPASLTAVAGSYSGYAGSSAGRQPTTFTVSASGAISGSVLGCAYEGVAAPHGSVNVFDMSVTFGGAGCIFGTATMKGIGYYDAVNKRLYGAAPTANRLDGFLVLGTKN